MIHYHIINTFYIDVFTIHFTSHQYHITHNSWQILDLQECMAHQRHVYLHRQSHYGINHQNYYWVHPNINPRQIFGVWVVYLQSYYYEDHFYKGIKQILVNWIRYFKSLAHQLKLLGPITAPCHCVAED